jgi:hypothetical protein
MEVIARLKYGFVSWLGRFLAQVRVNKVCKVHIDLHTYYAKERLWFGAALIAAGNIYLKRLGAHARVLPDDEWHRWESDVYRIAYDIVLVTDACGRLLIPGWSGVSLAAYLESEEISEAEKLAAIGLAAQSLYRLHNVVIQYSDGQRRALSHGDATVENVIVDNAQTTASWFDFDTIHESSMNGNWRHADDLRALTYSAAKRLQAAVFPQLAETIVAKYGDSATIDALMDAVARRRTRPISFHLAQARISYRNRQLLDEALLESWGCRRRCMVELDIVSSSHREKV